MAGTEVQSDKAKEKVAKLSEFHGTQVKVVIL